MTTAAAALDGMVRTPTGDERLRLDFLAASQEERIRFMTWMNNYYAAERRRNEYVAAWRDAPPPDVRTPEPRPTFSFAFTFYK